MTIKEVSEKYGISQDTLRYYERIGVIPAVERSSSGFINYDENTCGWIELAKCMRSAGVSIEALIVYCRLVQQGESTVSARKKLLEGEREKLVLKIDEMQKAKEKLDYKISIYENAEKTGVLEW